MNTKRNKYVGILLVISINLGLLIAFSWLWSAYAYPSATFTVSTTADTHDLNLGDGLCADSSGNCSLRAAIEEANTLAGADTIGLPAGTYLLSAGELWINDSLSLNGEAMATTVVDAQYMSRVFNIDNLNDNSLIDVNLSNITVQHGAWTQYGEEGGGGIRTSENLLIESSKIHQNLSYEVGGGLRARGSGSIVISNSQINSNEAHSGGGIVNGALKMTIVNCVLTDNSSISGGGIENGSHLTIINSTVGTNTSMDGGGIFNMSTMTITDSTIENNMSTDTGGGISNYYGNMIVANSIIQNNVSTREGGGIYNVEVASVQMLSSIIRDNIADYRGGGIYNEMSSSVHLENSEISGNRSKDGGGVYNDRSTMTINSSRIYSNTADTGAGAGIFNIDLEPPLESSNYILITSSLIDSNTTTDGLYPNGGGGIYIELTETFH